MLRGVTEQKFGSACQAFRTTRLATHASGPSIGLFLRITFFSAISLQIMTSIWRYNYASKVV